MEVNTMALVTTEVMTNDWWNSSTPSVGSGNYTTPSSYMTSPEHGVWRELHFWLPPICFILGITGNSLCLAAVCISRSLLPPATRIYASLILLSSDIILTSAAIRWLSTSLVDYLPASSTAQLAALQNALLNDIGCQLMEYFHFGALFVLVWLLVAMTGERYVTLARPFTVRRRSGCTAATISVVIILLGYGLAVSRFFTVEVLMVDDVPDALIRGIRYPIDCGLNDLGVMILLADVLVLYLLPPVFLAVLAICLSCMLCEYSRYRQQHRQRPTAGRTNNNKPHPELMARPNAELTITMAFIYAGGLLPMFAWSVLTLVSVIWGADPVVDTASQIALSIAQLLLLVLTASQFSYFLLAGGRFRQALGAIMCGCMCSSPTTSIGDEDEVSAHTGSNSSNGLNDKGETTSIGQVNLAYNAEMTQL